MAIGVVVLAFSLARDLPETNETGLVGLQYEEAEARPGTGLYIEIAGAVLVAAAGLIRLRRPGVSPSRDGS